VTRYGEKVRLETEIKMLREENAKLWREIEALRDVVNGHEAWVSVLQSEKRDPVLDVYWE
jgi:hypothetical protein